MPTEEEREANDLAALENDLQRNLYRKRKAARDRFNQTNEAYYRAELERTAAEEELMLAEREFARAVGLIPRTSRLP